MNLNFERVCFGGRRYRTVGRLYRESFPVVERLPLWFLCLLALRRDIEFYAIYDDTVFCGLLYVVNDSDRSLIFYFAVRGDLRGKGYGAEILNWLRRRKHAVSLIMESLHEKSENAGQRLRRKDFYLRNGFRDTGYYMKDSAGVFDILSTDPQIDPAIQRKLICKVLFWKKEEVRIGKF